MKVISKEANNPNNPYTPYKPHNPKYKVSLIKTKEQNKDTEGIKDLEGKKYKVALNPKEGKTQGIRGKLSPLDIKKKKIIQQIRTLLNDYPSVHPLAHKVLISANYRVLYDLHLNLMGLDGFAHKRKERKPISDKPTDPSDPSNPSSPKKSNNIGKKIAKEVPKNREVKNNNNISQTGHDDPMAPWDKENLDAQSPQYYHNPHKTYNQNTNIENIINALERAKRLTQKRRVIDLEQENPSKQKLKKSKNPFEDLEIELSMS
jgi:hypothetical protein